KEIKVIKTKKINIEKRTKTKIIIVTSFIDDEKVYHALEAGAMSYLLKTSKASTIAEAIRSTFFGQSILAPEVTGKIRKKMTGANTVNLHEQLTDREMEILLLMRKGQSNQEIADELYIALKTVKVHVSNILGKLEVHDRTQAVIYAFKHGLAEQ